MIWHVIKVQRKWNLFWHQLQIHCDRFQVAVVYIVVFVPSPPFHPKGVSSQSPSKNCSREGSSIVRHFLQTAWRPIFKKFDVQMPQECPLHFSRDVFKVQELAKLHYRVNLWTCGLCGNNQNWNWIFLFFKGLYCSVFDYRQVFLPRSLPWHAHG